MIIKYIYKELKDLLLFAPVGVFYHNRNRSLKCVLHPLFRNSDYLPFIKFKADTRAPAT